MKSAHISRGIKTDSDRIDESCFCPHAASPVCFLKIKEMPIVWQIADAKNHTSYVVFDDVVPNGMLVLKTDASGKRTTGILRGGRWSPPDHWGAVKRHCPFHIGTSGWHYAHWKGPFYPEDLPDREMLAFYASRFSTVEINNTFYRLPQKETLAGWRDSVPAGFIFSVKASRYITHMKKLHDVRKSLSLFFGTIDVLGGKLGPVLFQLPPGWHRNTERLLTFLSGLPKDYRYAFEFRDPSWFVPEIYDALSDFGASFCIYDLAGSLSPRKITADVVYIRLHGPDGPYRGQYGEKDLAGWASAFASWRKQKKEIYCYFDNDEAGYAAKNAMLLFEMTMTG